MMPNRLKITLIFTLCLLVLLPVTAHAQDAQPTPNRPSLPTDPIGGQPPQQPVTPPEVTEEAPDTATDETDANEPITETTPEPTPLPAIPDVETTDSDVCPVVVQPAFDAAAIACDGLNTGLMCLGNGTVEVATKAGIEPPTFANAGDRVAFTSLDEIRVRTANTETNQWSVAVGQLALPTTGGQQVNGSVLLFGDVTVVDVGEPPQISGGSAGTVIGGAGLNVRRQPNNQAAVVYQLRPGEEIITTGRTNDNEWLRIQIPTRFAGTGWAYAPYIEVAGGRETLPIVSADSPPPDLSVSDATFGTMQAVNMVSANTPAECEETPDSGLMLQSPSGTPDSIRFQINNVIVALNGTAFIRAEASGNMVIAVIEGEATLEVSDNAIDVPAGSQAIVSLDDTLNPTSSPRVVGYDETELADLPIRLAPRAFVLIPGNPNAGGGEVTVTGADTSTTDEAAPDTTTDTTQTTETGVCTITAIDSVKNLRGGPGTTFDVINTLAGEASIEGIGQALDEFGIRWYETPDGWIRFDTVRITDPCRNLPESGSESAAPVVTEEPQPTGSLLSTEVGEICGADPVTFVTISDGSTFAVSMGGAWNASAGTTVQIETTGGDMRPEFGDYIRINDASGNTIARSGDVRTLNYTFTADTTFGLQFSAANGNEVTSVIACQ